ncbi:MULTISPECIES: hypothetical protein [Photorhabdus]|uniref:Uncharacterized protein n=1 Tax=Photorhabdus kayaii TaxID=230088 RepID=A0ABX0AUD8_9GAMM|nr:MULTISPECIES: hypothetical protein [Photorhabdus]MCT8351732.1 hypothetical protein [Photorhabdus kayaii]MDB6368946.1 hypothetical protein [Photorhabdus bodei]NDL11107.1 hypothetical protein [Photorhabdus kayaii]NDL24422.1 hypothetical protein [Photorhabdus kayaii]RAX11438.1 hypothetical protein CKY10_04740 [Photorhabdus sp. HUG-39]
MDSTIVSNADIDKGQNSGKIVKIELALAKSKTERNVVKFYISGDVCVLDSDALTGDDFTQAYLILVHAYYKGEKVTIDVDQTNSQVNIITGIKVGV